MITPITRTIRPNVRGFDTLDNDNLGNPTQLLSMSFHEFVRQSRVANERNIELYVDHAEPVAQRRLDPVHAQRLAQYILKGLVGSALKVAENDADRDALAAIQSHLGTQPYMSLQPMVCNIRDDEHVNKEHNPMTATLQMFLSDRDFLYVIDGQHRREAIKIVDDFLKHIQDQQDFPRRPRIYPAMVRGKLGSPELRAWTKTYDAFGRSHVSIELHLGLDIDQERQLFYDLNSLGKRVEASLAFEFDDSNPVNKFIKDTLVDSDWFAPEVVSTDTRGDGAVITRKDLVAVNSILFLNKTNARGAQPADMVGKWDIGKRFWSCVNEIDGFGSVGSRHTTLASQPIVLKALAKIGYDLAFSRTANIVMLDRFIQGIPRINFKPANPMWRWYELTEEERASKSLEGLADYLPEGVRDIGTWDAEKKEMRFTSRHNDAVPILADMIRWQLSLTRRTHSESEPIIDTFAETVTPTESTPKRARKK